MRILFIGTGDIGIPSFRYLATRPGHKLVGLVTGEDKKVGRDQVLTPPAIKVVAMEFDIPVFQPAKIRNADALDQIDELVPDLIIVMAYGQILPKAVLRAPRRACLNLHASLLPRHRGASPIQSAIREGDSETGVTVMYVGEGLDTGDILCAERIPIDPGHTAGTLHDQLAALAPRALSRAIEYFDEGKNIPREPQDHEAATYLGKLRREDGAIDWNNDAAVLERLVRAYDPWPGCFTILPGGRHMKIYPATAARSEDGGGDAPGTVLAADARGIVVGCGKNSALVLSEVQAEGKKRLPVKDFLAGHPLAAGTILGEEGIGSSTSPRPASTASLPQPDPGPRS